MSKRPATVGRALAERGPSDGRPSRQRSKVTNGRALFIDGDNQSEWSRRYADLLQAHVGDLGGPSELSEGQLSLCRRAATLETELERLEGKLSKGEPIDLDLFSRVTGQLRRLLETIGLNRRARDVSLSRKRTIRERAMLVIEEERAE